MWYRDFGTPYTTRGLTKFLIQSSSKSSKAQFTQTTLFWNFNYNPDKNMESCLITRNKLLLTNRKQCLHNSNVNFQYEYHFGLNSTFNRLRSYSDEVEAVKSPYHSWPQIVGFKLFFFIIL